MGLFNASRISVILVQLCVCFGQGCSNVRVRPSEEESGPPVRGGTLEIVGLSDVDHLATTSAYVTPTWGLLRALTRTLVAYPASTDFGTATRLAPDMALEVPSHENGGVSPDGLTYTFHLRRGVRWDTNPQRAYSSPLFGEHSTV
jgi:ABC-type transport system substrate-binding protein